MADLIPSAEPFFLPAGPTGVLLVHGFTGTPKEMRTMGEWLAADGITTLGIRLAGHATQPADMLRARWQDWMVSLQDGWSLLSGYTNTIYAAGLSLGGVLSLLFASPRWTGRFPLAGVIAMSAPYALRPDWRLSYIQYFSLLQSQVPKGPPDWRDAAMQGQHIDYPAYPTRAIAELRDALAAMRQALPDVQVPALLIHSRQDTGGTSFDPQSMEKIYASLGSADKHMTWIEDSGHVITRDASREQVFQLALDFIHRTQEETA